MASNDVTWFFSVWMFSLGPNFPVFLPCIPAMNKIVELSIPRVKVFQFLMKYHRTLISLISLLQVKTASLSASTIGWSILKVAITFTVEVSHLSRSVITVSGVDTWYLIQNEPINTIWAFYSKYRWYNHSEEIPKDALLGEVIMMMPNILAKDSCSH